MKGLFFALALLVPSGDALAWSATMSSCSGTATATSAPVVFSQPAESYLRISNLHATTVLWVNPVGGAAAAGVAGSMSIPAGGFIEFAGPVQPSAVNIIASTGTAAYSCWFR